MVTVPRGEAPVQGRLRSGVGAVALRGEAECAMSTLGAQGRRRCGGSVRKVPHSHSVLLFMRVWEVVGSGFTAVQWCWKEGFVLYKRFQSRACGPYQISANQTWNVIGTFGGRI